jgi:hypothetical protein
METKQWVSWRLAVAAVVVALAAMTFKPAHLGAQNQADEGARVRELAERLLAGNTTPVGVVGPAVRQRQTAELLPGRLPDGLPFTLPMPPGSALVGSATRSAGGAPISADVLLEAPGSSGDIQAFYEQALADQGWTRPAATSGVGFQSSDQTPLAMCLGDDTSIMLALGPLAPGRTEVRLSVTLPSRPRASAGSFDYAANLCTARASLAAPSPPIYRRDLLPSLRPPAGSHLQDAGGAMGPDYATSEATVDTTLTAGELETSFARQLERIGWIKLDSGDAGAVAFSAWALPNEPDWFGMLAIMELPIENRYALTVRVESTSSVYNGD